MLRAQWVDWWVGKHGLWVVGGGRADCIAVDCQLTTFSRSVCRVPWCPVGGLVGGWAGRGGGGIAVDGQTTTFSVRGRVPGAQWTGGWGARLHDCGWRLG